jgi:Ca2+-binding EF-hand superfamily protein
VTSSPGNSISSNYHVDFDAMDANHDGNISRAEASGNADLVRDFHVVDGNHNGRLTREEMKGWLD